MGHRRTSREIERHCRSVSARLLLQLPVRLGRTRNLLSLTLIRTNRRAVTRHLFSSLDARDASTLPVLRFVVRIWSDRWWCRSDSSRSQDAGPFLRRIHLGETRAVHLRRSKSGEKGEEELVHASYARDGLRVIWEAREKISWKECRGYRTSRPCKMLVERQRLIKTRSVLEAPPIFLEDIAWNHLIARPQKCHQSAGYIERSYRAEIPSRFPKARRGRGGRKRTQSKGTKGSQLLARIPSNNPKINRQTRTSIRRWFAKSGFVSELTDLS